MFGESSTESQQDGQGIGKRVLRQTIEGPGTVFTCTEMLAWGSHRGLYGKDIVDKAAFSQLSPTVNTLRGHSMKLFLPRARLHVRKYFFSNPVVPHWNNLPQHVEAPSANSFKS